METRRLLAPDEPISQTCQYVRGTFNPIRTDDLRPEIVEHIGLSAVFVSNWYIEDGQHIGEWAMMVVYDDPAWNALTYWVPSGDIVRLPALEK